MQTDFAAYYGSPEKFVELPNLASLPKLKQPQSEAATPDVSYCMDSDNSPHVSYSMDSNNCELTVTCSKLTNLSVNNEASKTVVSLKMTV